MFNCKKGAIPDFEKEYINSIMKQAQCTSEHSLMLKLKSARRAEAYRNRQKLLKLNTLPKMMATRKPSSKSSNIDLPSSHSKSSTPHNKTIDYSECIVKSCTSNLNNTDITFYSIPVNHQSKIRWLRALGRMDIQNNCALYRICEKHFKYDQLIVAHGQKYLIESAVPCVDMGNQEAYSISQNLEICIQNSEICIQNSESSNQNSETSNEDSENSQNSDTNSQNDVTIRDPEVQRKNSNKIKVYRKRNGNVSNSVDMALTYRARKELLEIDNELFMNKVLPSSSTPVTTDTTPVTTDPVKDSMGHSNEKFKRALIRMVSTHIRKGGDLTSNIWASIEKSTGSDCTLLWQRMRNLTKSRMKRLLPNKDKMELVNPIVRMTRTDWLMYDLVLVHETFDVINTPCNANDEPLMDLLNLVVKYSIESLEVSALPKAWLQLSRDYNRNGRNCSIMLLQKRWYQIKAKTRHTFYEFWFNYHKNFNLCKQMPKYLYIETANMFPNIISTYFPKWEELVEEKIVVLPDVFESIINPKPKETETDVILVENNVEVVDLVEDNAIDKSIQNNSLSIKDKILADFDDYPAQSPKTEEVCPIIVKSEIGDDQMTDNLNEENDCLSQIQIVATTHVQEVDSVIEPDQEGTNNSETDSLLFSLLDKSDKVKNNVNNDQVQKEIIDISDEQSDSEVSTSLIKHKQETSKPDTVNEHVERSGNNINEMKEDEFMDLDIVDEGIDIVDLDADMDSKNIYEKLTTENTTEMKMEKTPGKDGIEKGNTENGDAEEAGVKFDKKLLMSPIVYTTKLSDMKVLKHKNFSLIEDINIINHIITESKPVYEIKIKQTEQPNILVKQENPQEIEELNDNDKMDITNPLFLKPKNCSYNPIILCKNPDFNTRLKRLSVGFLKIEKNRQLLKACKPVTIDLQKSFECNFLNGVLKLRDIIFDMKVNEPNNRTNNSIVNTIAPTALPAQALIDTAVEYIAKNDDGDCNDPFKTGLQLEINPAPKNTFEFVVSKPEPITNYVPTINEANVSLESSKNLPKNLCSTTTTMPTIPPTIQTAVSTTVDNIPKVKKKKDTRPLPHWLSRPRTVTVQDDALITEDTVRKMLNFFNKGKELYVGNKVNNKKQHPLNNTVEKCSEHASIAPHNRERPFNISNPPHISNPSAFKMHTFRTYCCWVRKYMESIVMSLGNFRMFAPRVLTHPCYKTISSICTCCCYKYWDDFEKDCAKQYEGSVALKRPELMYPKKYQKALLDKPNLSQPVLTIVPLTSTDDMPINPTINTQPTFIDKMSTSSVKKHTRGGRQKPIVDIDSITPPMSMDIDTNTPYINLDIEPDNSPLNVDNDLVTPPNNIYPVIPSINITSIDLSINDSITPSNVISPVIPSTSDVVPLPTITSNGPIINNVEGTVQNPKLKTAITVKLPMRQSNVTSLKSTVEEKSNNPVLISSEKGRISIDATLLYSQNEQSTQEKCLENKLGIVYRILPQIPGKKWLNIGPQKILLTTARISECEKALVANNENSNNIPSGDKNTPLRIETNAAVAEPPIDDVRDGQNKGSSDSVKKSILSDLMEMSGISAEDTDPKTSKEKEIPPVAGVVDLSIICSVAEIKWASENQAKFYTLDFDSGKIASVFIDKIKKVKPKTTISDTVIEIDDSDDDIKAVEPEATTLIDIKRVPQLFRKKLITRKKIKKIFANATGAPTKLNAEVKMNCTQSKFYSNPRKTGTPQKSLVSKFKENIKNTSAEQPMEVEYLSDSFIGDMERDVAEHESSDEEPLSKLKKLISNDLLTPDGENETILGI